MISRQRSRSRPLADFYAVLGVEQRAEQAEIRRAYRAAVKRHHPDAGGDPTGRMIRAVIEAYSVLGDEARRREYDRAWVAWRSGSGVGPVRRRRRRHSRGRRVLRLVRATGLLTCLVAAAVLLAVAVAGASAGTDRMGSGLPPRRVEPARPELAVAVRIPFEFAVPFERSPGANGAGGPRAVSSGGE